MFSYLQNGDIALLVYLKEVEHLSDNVVQAFLRCGSDVTLKNNVSDHINVFKHMNLLGKKLSYGILEE